MCYERRRAEACVDESAHHAPLSRKYNFLPCKRICHFLTCVPFFPQKLEKLSTAREGGIVVMGNAHGSAIIDPLGLEPPEETWSVLCCFGGLP
jgi:hypothetical protein